MANRDLPVVQRILDRLKARYPNITRDQVIHYLSEARAKYYSGKLVGQQINNLVQVIFQLIEDDLQGAPMANRDLPVLQRILDRLKARYPNITRDQVIHYLSEARAKYYSGKLVGQQINKLVQVIFQLIEDDLQGVHAPCQETGTAAALDWDSLNMWAEFRAYLRR